jgi:histidinol phosphatase-like enzyme
MILQAQKDLNIDLAKSYMIWDSEKDIIAWKKSGCKTILYNSQKLNIENLAVKPDFVVKDFLEILSIID